VNVGPQTWSTICAGLLSLAVVLSAAPASADPTDDAFVAALAKEGIAFTDHNTAIATAHTVCAGLDKSDKSSVLAMKLMQGHRSLAEAIQLLHRRFHFCLLPAIRWADGQFGALAPSWAPADVISRLFAGRKKHFERASRSFPAQPSMCVGGSAKPRSQGCWSGPIKSQRLSGTRKELAPLYTRWGTATQRCQVPSGWTGPSHLLITGPPYWQPALAGGADAISSPVISTAARPPTMQVFMVVSRHIAAGAFSSACGGKYPRQPSQQPMTLPRM
jgi:hypothetical protein